MRITIHTDEQGNVNIDTDKPTEQPGMFHSTPDIPVIDAGGAPSEHLQRWNALTNAAVAAEPSMEPAARYPEAELPLNPLRAGAAAAYANPANKARAATVNQETTASAYSAVSAAADSSAAVDGGAAAHIPKSSAPPEPAPKAKPKGKKKR